MKFSWFSPGVSILSYVSRLKNTVGKHRWQKKIIILITSPRLRCLGHKQKAGALPLPVSLLLSVSRTFLTKTAAERKRLRRGERVVFRNSVNCYHTRIRFSKKKKTAPLISISAHRRSRYRAARINGIFTHYIDSPAEINGWEQIRGAVLIALAPCRRWEWSTVLAWGDTRGDTSRMDENITDSPGATSGSVGWKRRHPVTS